MLTMDSSKRPSPLKGRTDRTVLYIYIYMRLDAIEDTYQTEEVFRGFQKTKGV